MEIVYPRCAAVDVHKQTAVATVGWVDELGQRQKQTRTFGTMTGDLERLQRWLAEFGVTHVAMESTGVYWKPVFNILEDGGLTVVLANAAHVKAVPGRKTDVRDSEWLLELLQHGLIRGSFIPEAPIRAVRDLTRYRTSLIEERTRELNRIQKVLEDANIKLASVATDVMGVSGRAMLEALVAGETDPAVLAELARGRLRRKQAALAEALTGRVRDHHRVLLKMLLALVDHLDQAIAELSAEIALRLEPYAGAMALLCTIAGVQRRVAEVVVAEIGTDMGRFAGARHLCSWAAICPGNDESAGKRRSGRTRHGNRWLRAVLVQAAWAAIKVKGGYFGAQFRRIAKRRGEKRAIVAVAHSLLTVIYHVLNDGTVYQDLGADYFDRLAPGRRIRYHLKRLAELGYAVTLAPVVVGQPSPPPTTTSETGGGNVDGRSGPDAVHPVRRAKRA
jgi:transposase